MGKDLKTSAPTPAAATARSRKKAWPEGATAGLVLVASACVGLSVTLYHVAGPRDVFASDQEFMPR